MRVPTNRVAGHILCALRVTVAIPVFIFMVLTEDFIDWNRWLR